MYAICSEQLSWSGGFCWSFKTSVIFFCCCFIVRSQVEEREEESIERKNVAEEKRK